MGLKGCSTPYKIETVDECIGESVMAFKSAFLQKQASPEVARWGGMSFRIQYPPKEHNPPHFHVRVGQGSGKGDTCPLNIWDLKPTPGETGGILSSVQITKIKDWFATPVGNGKTVQTLMQDNWLLAQAQKPLVKIPTPQELKSKKASSAVHVPAEVQRHGRYAIMDAVPVTPWHLRVTFYSGERKLVDVHAMFGNNPMFDRLWDWDEFKKVRVEPNTVLWYKGINELEIEDQDLWAYGESCV